MVQRVVARQETWEFALSLPLVEAYFAMDTRQVQLDDGIASLLTFMEHA